MKYICMCMYIQVCNHTFVPYALERNLRMTPTPPRCLCNLQIPLSPLHLNGVAAAGPYPWLGDELYGVFFCVKKRQVIYILYSSKFKECHLNYYSVFMSVTILMQNKVKGKEENKTRKSRTRRY